MKVHTIIMSSPAGLKAVYASTDAAAVKAHKATLLRAMPTKKGKRAVISVVSCPLEKESLLSRRVPAPAVAPEPQSTPPPC